MPRYESDDKNNRTMNEIPKLTAAHRALGLTEYESKMERYADQLESEIKALKQSDCISNISDCILFATWLQDNYSTNIKQGSNIPLGKGRWREDFSNTIYSVEVLWDKWWNNH